MKGKMTMKNRQRGVRAAISAMGMVVALASVVLPAPAHAAVASGSAVAGSGGRSCTGVTCTTFTTAHSLAANDIDASVRAVNVGGQTRMMTWSATTLWPVGPKILIVWFFPASCMTGGSCSWLGQQDVPAGGGPVTFPAGTAYIVVYPVDTFHSLRWTLE
jgi:hypothetical protein